jgi:voltage-gated potassium channel
VDPQKWFFRFVTRKPLTPARAGRAIALATTLVTIACGVVMRLVDSTDFDSVWLALWWAVQTVTTVGYGDEVPTNTAGRLVGAVLMLIGIGFLTVVTASITAAFIENARRRGGAAETNVEAKLNDIDAKLEELAASLNQPRP